MENHWQVFSQWQTVARLIPVRKKIEIGSQP